ncbi:MAG: 50S ribosomal protein L9 [Verrucomicrobiales bacterium]|nr:50S ribosomal protein L9 [Verrucomicrobiales bacterium]|tara:strand:- start:697 stop:1239 length:543 start_codon:yes stop_codon:yes gene_type:complete
MAKTEVILTENVTGLGAESDKVEVAAGYARNFLLPQGRAVSASAANERYLAALQARRDEREAHEKETMEALRESLSHLLLVIKVKTGEGGKLFGSVTAGMIADELRNQFGVDLDRRKINLPQAIRELGDHEVNLKLHADIEGTLKVQVESENPIIEPAAEEEKPKKEAPKAEEAPAGEGS